MATAIQVVHKTLPGRRDTVRDVWAAHMPSAIDANDGHLAYFYTLDHADEDTIRAHQIYSDEQAATRFLEDPAYLAYVEAVEPFLSGPPQVFRSKVEWQKGAGDAC